MNPKDCPHDIASITAMNGIPNISKCIKCGCILNDTRNHSFKKIIIDEIFCNHKPNDYMDCAKCGVRLKQIWIEVGE